MSISVRQPAICKMSNVLPGQSPLVIAWGVVLDLSRETTHAWGRDFAWVATPWRGSLPMLSRVGFFMHSHPDPRWVTHEKPHARRPTSGLTRSLQDLQQVGKNKGGGRPSAAPPPYVYEPVASLVGCASGPTSVCARAAFHGSPTSRAGWLRMKSPTQLSMGSDPLAGGATHAKLRRGFHA